MNLRPIEDGNSDFDLVELRDDGNIGKQVCGKEKELHHVVSYDLAKVIVVKQLGEPETDEEHRYVQQTIRTFRKRNGKIPVCKGECHDKLNNKQKQMVKVIEKYVNPVKVAER